MSTIDVREEDGPVTRIIFSDDSCIAFSNPYRFEIIEDENTTIELMYDQADMLIKALQKMQELRGTSK